MSILAAGLLFAQMNSVGVTELVLKPEGDDARVRPFESMVIQVRAYGQATKANGGGAERVRLQRSGAKASVATAGGGWVSKPFKFQGTDSEAFYQEASTRFAQI